MAKFKLFSCVGSHFEQSGKTQTVQGEAISPNSLMRVATTLLHLKGTRNTSKVKYKSAPHLENCSDDQTNHFSEENFHFVGEKIRKIASRSLFFVRNIAYIFFIAVSRVRITVRRRMR